MARLIAVSILPDHSRAEDGKFFVVCRMIGKHAVQFLCKAACASCEINQTVYVMLHGPEVLPAVAFADMRSVFVGFEVFDKVSFIVTRLHERSGRVVNILVVLRTFVEFVRYLFLAHLVRHLSNAVIVKCIFQCFGQ